MYQYKNTKNKLKKIRQIQEIKQYSEKAVFREKPIEIKCS